MSDANSSILFERMIMVVERIVSVCSHQNFQILNYYNLNIILVLKWSFLFAYLNSNPYFWIQLNPTCHV